MSSMIKVVKHFAAEAHKGQFQGARPYIEHPEQVAGVLIEHGFSYDEGLILAAWLHDTIEDTSVTFDEVEQTFGSDVAELVDYVTQREGANRKERIKLTYPHTRKSSRAVALKVADRIANVRYALEDGSDYINMYKDEWPGFKKALYRQGEHENLWETLSSLLK